MACRAAPSLASPCVPACRAGRRAQACAARASSAKRATAVVLSAEPAGATRRQLLVLVGTAAVVLRAKPALAKVPAGFNALKDTTKGYAFVYPVGWQEVVQDGQDKAFKDVIEPLESVSLSVAPTTRASLAEAGTPQEVGAALVAKSAAPGTKVELVSAVQRVDAAGIPYYAFEFTSSARGVTRHAITTLAVANGKVFTLTTGCSQARWSKMAERLQTVSDSFTVLGY